ncbi:MAG: class I SAM-dependent methyltransferase [Pyrinomonadaceae bacterium]
MEQLDEVRRVYDTAADKYAEKFAGELAHKPLDRVLLKRFAEDPPIEGQVADIGCGCGHTTAHLKRLGVEEIIGYDLSPEMIETARRMNPGIAFETANMLKLVSGSESFSKILCFYAIIHFTYEEISQAFSEFFRVLRQGGLLFFSFHVGNEVVEPEEFLGVQTDVKFYELEVDAILEILVEIGFHIEDTIIRYPYTDYEYPSKRAYIFARKPNFGF